MKKRGGQRGKPALDLIEEAVHLLRQSPVRLLLVYFIGTAPFVLGLLFFWADMSVGAFAARRCPTAALGMAALFLWMKCWQTVFVCGLRARLAAAPAPTWNFRRALNLLVVQGIVQPSKLFLLPLALLATIPFGWVLAFYENVTALGDGNGPGVRAVLHRALAQARLWPVQNHFLLALLTLLAFTVWLNALIAVATVPGLLKMFFGVETAFTRGGFWSLFNSTFLAATVALAWLAIDPLVKTIYALRCFYGDARQDGADLLAELTVVRARSGKPLALVTAVLFVLGSLHGFAAAEKVLPSAPARVESPETIPPQELDEAVRATLAQDKYSWRLPREKIPETDPQRGWLQGFIQGVSDTVAKWARAVRDFIRDVYDWLAKIFKPKHAPDERERSGHKTDWMLMLRGFAFLLLALAAAALGILLYRLWRQGWRRPKFVRAEVIAAQPDLTDENVTASQLPEDGWLQLARELMDKGELRLALRAFYLAGLAHLAARELVSIARFKSNRDYELEVGRRARGYPELRAAFSENIVSFDCAWYGLHEVTRESLQHFQGNLDRIRAC